ncbi:MAG: hypothetical protein LBN22_04090 [Clostridiales Family XIII bacterium]|nr:hypothetical protein [Clostridiales Family XIII bacterium]
MSDTKNDKAKSSIQIFEDENIRTAWDEERAIWYFSIVDVVGVLTNQDTPRGASNYWAKLKERLLAEGSQLLTNCQQLKMIAADGKKYKTDVANMEQILRIIQSIPSSKVEPLKMWLASIGSERIDEVIDPDLTMNRVLTTYMKKGYSREQINQRFQTIPVRKELIDEWKNCDIENGIEYAILANEISKACSEETCQCKNPQRLKSESLSDNMTALELALNIFLI